MSYSYWTTTNKNIKKEWFTDALKSHIPDDFMPAEALRNENARAPGGRRKTLENTGALRRVSLALGSNASVSNSDAEAVTEIVVPSPHSLARMGDGPDGSAAQPNRQPGRAAPASAVTSAQGAAGLADASGAVVVDVDSDGL